MLQYDNNSVHINPSSTIIVTLDNNSEITINGNVLASRFNTANSAFITNTPIDITPTQIKLVMFLGCLCLLLKQCLI